MTNYNVTVFFHGSYSTEIKARDEQGARMQAFQDFTLNDTTLNTIIGRSAGLDKIEATEVTDGKNKS